MAAVNMERGWREREREHVLSAVVGPIAGREKTQGGGGGR